MGPVGEAARGVDRTAMVTTMYFFAILCGSGGDFRVVLFVLDSCMWGISNYKK